MPSRRWIKAIRKKRSRFIARRSRPTPQDAALEYKLAIALDRAGDETGERTALEQAIQIDPNLAVAQNQLGYLYYKSGQYETAEEHFRQAIQANPDFAQAWVQPGCDFGFDFALCRMRMRRWLMRCGSIRIMPRRWR